MIPKKFRYWNNIEKQMTYSNDFGSLEGFFCHYESGSNILMQFTGLKDKNGKDIYEGDILIFPGGDYKETIEYRSESCGCCSTIYGYEISNPDEKQIIGNIHENPELLENI